MIAPTISRDELRTWLDQGLEFLLIDTALDEDYASQHLPSAKNACVFEVNFLDQVSAAVGLARGRPQHDLPVVVYGASARSLASVTAADKLLNEGYVTVRDFREGLAGWLEAGLPVEGNGHVRQDPALEDRDYKVDHSKSVLEWVGRSLGGRHQGRIALLEGGTMTLRGGRVVDGNFTIDMTTIEDTDISDGFLKGVLQDHLKSDDFFDVSKYPVASFHLESVNEIVGASPSGPNYQISGKFTLKGIEKPLTFTAQIGRSPEGNGELVARANFDLDRTEWNVRYGSGKFYEKLGKHLVSDLITLDLKLVAY